MKTICSIKTWQQFKRQGLVNCGYIEFAIWIPIILWSENLIYKITGKDFHWSGVSKKRIAGVILLIVFVLVGSYILIQISSIIIFFQAIGITLLIGAMLFLISWLLLS